MVLSYCSNKLKRVSTKKAFTLIELLVVIAIIALLLSIVMPALRKVKDQAKIILCKANVRSVALTVAMYAGDYDGKMFPYGSGLFINELSAYTDEMDEIRYCPATKKMDESTAVDRWGTSKDTWCWSSGLPEPEQGSFGLNGWIYYYDIDDIRDGDYSWIESQTNMISYPFPSYVGITAPSSVPVFLDAVWVDLWPKHTDVVPADLDLAYGGGIGNPMFDNPVKEHIRRAMIDRHFGKCNLGFADGHAEAVDLARLWGLKWHREFEIYDDVMTRIDGSPIYPEDQ